MPGGLWHWLTRTDGGLLARIGAGIVIFGWLALMDVRRNGSAAQRWREYVFLLAAAGLSMVYGLVNDLLTASISWEYFYYGKGLDQALGAQVPPDRAGLLLAAGGIGLKSTWTAGLLGGVAILIANNPRRNRPRLPYRTLYRLLPIVLVPAAMGAAVFGILGHNLLLAWVSTDLTDLVQQDLFRPPRFLCALGIHLGGYVGALLGVVGAVIWIIRRRAATASATSAAGQTTGSACTPGPCCRR